jgi:diguanylate cyclase
VITLRNLLTWLLYGHTGGPIDPSSGRLDAGRLAAAARLMKSLAQTVTGLLGVAQEQAMNVPSLQPAVFREELRKIATRYAGPLSPGEGDSLRKQSVRLIAGQREQECEYIRGRERELQAIIALIGEDVQDATAETQEYATQMQAALADLGRAVEIDDLREVRERIRTHLSLAARALETKRQREQERLRSLEEQVEVLTHKVEITPQAAQTDPLTTLYSREAFDKQIRTEVSLANRLKRPLSMVLIDVDHLQLANETYGREAIDDVLVRLAGRIIREFFRKTDFIARCGGDEFAVLLTQEQLDVARRAAEGLCRNLQQRPLQTRAGDVTITISAGVTQYRPGESWEELLARAEGALQQAKQGGCNRVTALPATVGQRAA